MTQEGTSLIMQVEEERAGVEVEGTVSVQSVNYFSSNDF
jgi:hypothetical protein